MSTKKSHAISSIIETHDENSAESIIDDPEFEKTDPNTGQSMRLSLLNVNSLNLLSRAANSLGISHILGMKKSDLEISQNSKIWEFGNVGIMGIP